LGNGAVGVVEVTEESSASGTYFDAFWCEVPHVNSLETECALLRYADWSDWDVWVPKLEL
jgi:hypothetical protein